MKENSFNKSPYEEKKENGMDKIPQKIAGILEDSTENQINLEKGVNKLLPIESGKIIDFNTLKQIGFIQPDDGSPSLTIRDTREFKAGEKVYYIKTERAGTFAALVTRPGMVIHAVKGKGKNESFRSVIIEQEGGNLGSIPPHAGYMKSDEKEEFEYGDKVDFVTGKNNIIVAIQKKK